MALIINYIKLLKQKFEAFMCKSNASWTYSSEAVNIFTPLTVVFIYKNRHLKTDSPAGYIGIISFVLHTINSLIYSYAAVNSSVPVSMVSYE